MMTHNEIINLDESEDEKKDIKVNSDMLDSSGIDGTSENCWKCPICNEEFASNAELGTHVVNHNSASVPVNSSFPNATLDDQNRVASNGPIIQALENVPFTISGGDGKVINIFTGNPNLRFQHYVGCRQ